MKYLANDGKVFLNIKDCVEYEKSLVKDVPISNVCYYQYFEEDYIYKDINEHIIPIIGDIFYAHNTQAVLALRKKFPRGGHTIQIGYNICVDDTDTGLVWEDLANYIAVLRDEIDKKTYELDTINMALSKIRGNAIKFQGGYLI